MGGVGALGRGCDVRHARAGGGSLASGGVRRGGRPGFTLVEIAISLAVFAILTAFAVPSLRVWRDRTDLRGAVSGVSQAMLEARTRAVVERRQYTVSVDYAADTYGVSPAIPARRPRPSVDLHADTTDPDCPPLSDQSVAFRPNGTADAAGFEAIFLRSRNTRVAARYRVKVLGATGKVTAERLAGGTWTGLY